MRVWLMVWCARYLRHISTTGSTFTMQIRTDLPSDKVEINRTVSKNVLRLQPVTLLLIVTVTKPLNGPLAIVIQVCIFFLRTSSDQLDQNSYLFRF